MIVSTPQTPFVHFEHLMNLIHFGIEKSKEFEGKKDVFKAFHDTVKNANRVFIPTNGAMSCIRFDNDSPMIMFPFQTLQVQQHLALNNWQKLLVENGLTKLPHDYMFIQLEFGDQGFIIQDEKGNLINNIFAVGLFARNVVLDKQNKIALGYGLLHNSGNPKGKLTYDIMDTIHLLSVTDKKARLVRTDYNFKPLENAPNSTLPIFERYILSRLAMTMIMKKKQMNGAFIEGVLQAKPNKRKGA